MGSVKNPTYHAHFTDKLQSTEATQLTQHGTTWRAGGGRATGPRCSTLNFPVSLYMCITAMETGRRVRLKPQMHHSCRGEAQNTQEQHTLSIVFTGDFSVTPKFHL